MEKHLNCVCVWSRRLVSLTLASSRIDFHPYPIRLSYKFESCGSIDLKSWNEKNRKTRHQIIYEKKKIKSSIQWKQPQEGALPRIRTGQLRRTWVFHSSYLWLPGSFSWVISFAESHRRLSLSPTLSSQVCGRARHNSSQGVERTSKRQSHPPSRGQASAHRILMVGVMAVGPAPLPQPGISSSAGFVSRLGRPCGLHSFRSPGYQDFWGLPNLGSEGKNVS